MIILVTGSAGFIGSHLALRLLDSAEPLTLVGIDNLNDYYDPSLKAYRLKTIEEKARLRPEHKYEFIKGDITDGALIDRLFREYRFDTVVNLAAQAGVRYSLKNPEAFLQSNVIGFYNILEASKEFKVSHLVQASSSSIYGNSSKVPFSVSDKTDDPVSFYAATKKSNELFAHCYSKLYDLPVTCLRFFSVYGPAGRPDMAYYSFTDRLLRGLPIQIYNYGNCERDFTYVEDVINGILCVLQKPPVQTTGEDGIQGPPFRIYNIGSGHPVKVFDFIEVLQEELLNAGLLPQDFDFASLHQNTPMQPGDLLNTFADIKETQADFGWSPNVPLREGLRRFIAWYKTYAL